MSIFARTGLWLWGTIAMATLAFGAGMIQLAEGPGKAILEGSCASCHNLSRITSKQYDKDSWDGMVQSMRDKGAQVTDEEATVLVEYLAKNFGKGGAAPAGASAGPTESEIKELIENSCTTCHLLDIVERERFTKDEWKTTVQNMMSKGARVSDAEFPALVDYLTKHYGTDKK